MQIETIFKALADPTRLRIMRLLLAMELAVGELADVLAQSQPRVSRHIAILCDAGLAARRREGSWVFLHHMLSDMDGDSASESNVRCILARLLVEGENADPDFARICTSDRDHLDRIRATREQRASEYFSAIAEHWDHMRAMIAPEGIVEDALLDCLGTGRDSAASSQANKENVPRAPLGEVLDIGTGTGRIAELTAPFASHVTALDKSPEMLGLARVRLQSVPSEQLSLVQGNFSALPFKDASFDTILFHQVLHYAQAPEYALAEAGRVCRPGGRIAIVDLAAHNHEDLRRSHAHVRLGFDDSHIASMLRESGFALRTTRTLDGAELDVKIWAGRRSPTAAHNLPIHTRAAHHTPSVTTANSQ